MRWASVIAETLDRVLPRRYFAEVHTHLGKQITSDVAEFEQTIELSQDHGVSSDGVAVQTWAPPVPTMVLPFVCPVELEVRILDERDDARLVAVVELVSPRNKEDSEACRAFAAKCATYLQRGIGVVVVDIVTTRHANLHNELIDVLRMDAPFRLAPDVLLVALAYRPTHRDGQDEVDVWAVPVQLGGTFPVLPLALRGAGLISLDLEATYNETRQRCRL
jgi:hypothetical protein